MEANMIVNQDFNQVYTIIDIHRKRAFQEINNNSLLIAWNVGGYVSAKIKSSEWGSSVVTELSEYLRTKDPGLKGYSRHEKFEVKELQRAIKTNAYESVLGSTDFKSPILKELYPDTGILLKDTAYLDFLGLPHRYKESRLRKGIVSHMKDFILELGKDFLFVDEEHQLEVGEKKFKCDLLFYHRGGQLFRQA